MITWNLGVMLERSPLDLAGTDGNTVVIAGNLYGKSYADCRLREGVTIRVQNREQIYYLLD